MDFHVVVMTTGGEGLMKIICLLNIAIFSILTFATFYTTLFLEKAVFLWVKLAKYSLRQIHRMKKFIPNFKVLQSYKPLKRGYFRWNCQKTSTVGITSNFPIICPYSQFASISIYVMISILLIRVEICQKSLYLNKDGKRQKVRKLVYNWN